MARKYISLQEATKYCNYSQEYLSLRARQGKLKAIKFGRNWVIKKEWLNEYLLGIEEYNDSFAKEKKTIASPRNLPTEEQFEKDVIRLDVRKILKPKLQVRFGFVVIFTLSLIVTSLIFGQESFKSVYQNVSTFVGSIDKEIDEVLANMPKEVQEIVRGINNNIDRKTIEIVEISKWVLGNISDETANPKSFVSEIKEMYNLADEFLDKKVVDLGRETYDTVSKSAKAVVSFVNNSLFGFSINKSVKSFASEVIDGYIAADNFVEKKILDFAWAMFENISGATRRIVQSYFAADDFFEKKLSQRYKTITQLFKAPEEIKKEELIPKSGEEGMVVIPSTEKDEELKKKIEEAFSDEIVVEVKDKTSGIIKPIFKKDKDQEYLYILVPIKH